MSDLATVQQLERDNADLKRQMGAIPDGKRALTKLRVLMLERENRILRKLLALMVKP